MKPSEHRGLAFFVLVTVGLGVGGCASLGGGGLNLLSTADEIRLGRQVADRVEEEQTVLDNEAVQAYVRQIGERLAKEAGRNDIEYSFKVIDAPETINAFALPGGFMYVYTGLMLRCENEAELAGVMAHEIGHVAGRHHGEAMTQQFGFELITRILLGGDSGSAVEAVVGMVTTMGGLAFSRENEREADRLGMAYLVGAGYGPSAMGTFMERVLLPLSGSGGRVAAIMSTHPATVNRVALLRAMEETYPPEVRRDNKLHRERYEARALSALR